ncbi:hypothetical protein JVT61DRAFT_14529 [Boletus reticuloceps]|uniref:Uncharacterized protein n=1 Tax=Boletus reticuloceps TaxID=495285 RepID=A0A8I2YSZ2_9AGAM|nr:hypothetical protein JVT61DRAFT_14529 [Boletus reticuloceps]
MATSPGLQTMRKSRTRCYLRPSHDALKQSLDGIAFEVQATDPSEISYCHWCVTCFFFGGGDAVLYIFN